MTTTHTDPRALLAAAGQVQALQDELDGARVTIAAGEHALEQALIDLASERSQVEALRNCIARLERNARAAEAELEEVPHRDSGGHRRPSRAGAGAHRRDHDADYWRVARYPANLRAGNSAPALPRLADGVPLSWGVAYPQGLPARRSLASARGA